MATTPPVSISLSMRIAEILNPRLGAAPDPKALAKYFCEALLTIAKEGLPVRVYLDHRITESVAPLLKELGVKFRTVSPDSMKPPYIYLFLNGDKLVIETVDMDLRGRRYVARFDLFLEELAALLIQVKTKRKEYRREEEAKPKGIDLFDMEPKEFLKLLEEILEEER